MSCEIIRNKGIWRRDRSRRRIHLYPLSHQTDPSPDPAKEPLHPKSSESQFHHTPYLRFSQLELSQRGRIDCQSVGHAAQRSAERSWIASDEECFAEMW